MSNPISDLEDSIYKFVDSLYPVVNEPSFFLLPIPAAYELFTTWNQGHSDGMQLRRATIIGTNILFGYVMYNYGGGLGTSIMNSYLLAGTGYYLLFHLLLPNGPMYKPIPDTDPCGNPITRGGPDGHTGGGGAC